MSIINNKYKIDFNINGKNYKIFDTLRASRDANFFLQDLPFSLRVLFENVVRQTDNVEYFEPFTYWCIDRSSNKEINFMPSRVLMQDFTGIPAIVDLAAMRDMLKKLNKDPQMINPQIPVDLVIDHSVQVDYAGSDSAFAKNVTREYERNGERYEFLKWAQGAFTNLRVVPPGTGICHQVNLEYFAQVVCVKEKDGETLLYPDSLVGTDSHTTMVNGLSVLGWGVGGIEAESAMLGQALPMILPDVIRVELSGIMEGPVNVTDLVLTVTQILRKKGVVGKFVEFAGPGVANLTVEDRATIANMSPEFGATCCFFAIDQETLDYLRLVGKDEEHIKLVEKYAKAQLLWENPEEVITYTDTIYYNLADLQTSLAGPTRPQDRILLSSMKENFKKDINSLAEFDKDINKTYAVKDQDYVLKHGSVVIAAITSCTNTSNPYVMVAAGLLAKAAYEKNLQSKPWVKTSLAPGSHVVTEYLKLGNLNEYLDHLGFNLVGYGCTTCIGNSGPLKPEIVEAIASYELVVASVLSGNRNFEGRIHRWVRANYLAAPPLVVAYAIAGDVSIDLINQPLGQDKEGNDIYLKDIWPSKDDINNYIRKYVKSKIFKQEYQNILVGDEAWQNLKIEKQSTYNWNASSSYIRKPPFFDDFTKKETGLKDIVDAKILAILGDSITTDHISPAGNIATNSPAGRYLMMQGVEAENFNSYGSRRGNHEVMIRGTYSNRRIKNEMCNGQEGGITVNQLTGLIGSIYEVSMEYMKNNVFSIVFAGKEYGMGSSRDWAAKGVKLLGVKAIIAESFERIHRSNLVGMGVLPFLFEDNMTRHDLNLTGSENVDIHGLDKDLRYFKELTCSIKQRGNIIKVFKVKLNILTEVELEYIKQGGLMHQVVRSLIK